MSSAAIATRTMEWPSDVLAFAVKEGIRDYLDPLWEATWRVFPGAREIIVTQEDDPELRDDRYLVFEVRVPREDVPDYVEANHRWNREFFDVCPAPLSHLIRLALTLVTQ